MELISLKAACDAIFKEYDDYPYGERARGLNDAAGIILDKVPTIPAVPLDKLCALLAKNADCPPEHSPVQDHCKENCAECWKSVLKEWMEEQDESN